MSEVRRPRVAVVGVFQIGKSTLINCLLGGTYAHTGSGLATTRICTEYRFGNVEEVRLAQPDSPPLTMSLAQYMSRVTAGDLRIGATATVVLRQSLLQRVDLIDTPGFDRSDDDGTSVQATIKHADMLVLVIRNRALSDAEEDVLKSIHRQGKRFWILVNCMGVGGQANPEGMHCTEMVRQIAASVKSLGCEPEPISGRLLWPCNFLWFSAAAGLLGMAPEATHSDLIWSEISKAFGKQPPSLELLAGASKVPPVIDAVVTATSRTSERATSTPPALDQTEDISCHTGSDLLRPAFYALVHYEIESQPHILDKKGQEIAEEFADNVFRAPLSLVVDRVKRGLGLPQAFVNSDATSTLERGPLDSRKFDLHWTSFRSRFVGSNYDVLCSNALVFLARNNIAMAEKEVNIAKLNHDDRAFAHHVYGLLRGLQGDEAGARFELYLALQRETYEDAKRRIECALRVLDTVRTPNHASAMLPR
jgi:hypothetical protein